MRISLLDSTMNGFKKWSDAQRPKGDLATIASGPEQAKQRISAVRKEDASDGAE
jgi:hypothetical protein